MSLEAEKQNDFKSAVLSSLKGIIFSLAIFYFFSIVFFEIFYWFRFGWKYDFVALLKYPDLLWAGYKNWWVEIENRGWSQQLYIPLLAPVVSILLIAMYCCKTKLLFKLWYGLVGKYARLKHIKKMDLFGSIMFLGKFNDHVVRLSQFYSVFVLGKSGLRKTLSVAVPSILESDSESIVAVDTKGHLHKYTSGYRRTMSEVFYFDWDLVDDVANGKIFARWNPLSPNNLPPFGEKREKYLASLAQSLLSRKSDGYWDKMAQMALEGMLSAFVSKVEQACANDYFLHKIMAGDRLSASDKDALLSYYASMPRKHTFPVIKNILNDELNLDNYLPIGSWANVPEPWKGKELCLPMCADSMIRHYFMDEADGKPDGFKLMLSGLIREAKFFGYMPYAIQVMEHLSLMSPAQRKSVFMMIIDPLMVFCEKSIRERTSLSDFSNTQLCTNKGDPLTIYCNASSENGRFMSKLMIDVLIEANLTGYKSKHPLLFVLDDFDKLNKLENLNKGLLYGMNDRISFLLINTNMSELEKRYGMEDTEEIISRSGYKLVVAENNKLLSEQFEKLAKYGTKAVQIPHVRYKFLFGRNKSFSDANYYNSIAKKLLNAKEISENQHILLAEGHYHQPVKVDAVYFYDDVKLNAKASIESSFVLDEQYLEKRNAQDIEVPLVRETLNDFGVDVRGVENVAEYLSERYDTPKTEVQEAPKIDNEEWWLEDESFSTSLKRTNPFKGQL